MAPLTLVTSRDVRDTGHGRCDGRWQSSLPRRGPRTIWQCREGTVIAPCGFGSFVQVLETNSRSSDNGAQRPCRINRLHTTIQRNPGTCSSRRPQYGVVHVAGAAAGQQDGGRGVDERAPGGASSTGPGAVDWPATAGGGTCLNLRGAPGEGSARCDSAAPVEHEGSQNWEPGFVAVRGTAERGGGRERKSGRFDVDAAR